jgi:PAS domain S-box-containing protein
MKNLEDLLNRTDLSEDVRKVIEKEIDYRNRIEYELKRTEEKYKTLVIKSSEGMAILNKKEKKYIFANPTMADSLGYTIDELLGIKITCCYNEESLPRVLSKFNEIKANEDSWVKGVSLLKKDGNSLYADIKMSDIIIEGKEYIVKFIKDITEQKAIREEIIESRERYKALHEASFGGIALHDKSVILDCNKGLSEMMGYAYSELVGMDGLLLIAESSRDFVMDKIISGYEKPYEANGVRKDGVEFPMRLAARNVPFKGKIVRTVEFRDLTDIKKREEELRKSKEIYQNLREFLPLGLFELDLKGNVLYGNKAILNLTGYTKQDISKLNMLDIIHPDYHEKVFSVFNQIINGEEGKGNEYLVHKKDDNTFFGFINTHKTISYDGNEGVQGYIFDLTRLKLAEEEVKKAIEHAAYQDKLATIGQVAGKMAHDFNNVLGIIRGNAELALLEEENPEKRSLLEMFIEQADRGANLTRNLVAFAKDKEPDFLSFDITSKIDLVLDLLRKDLSHIEVLRDYNFDVHPVLGDPGMIQHALINLVQNSVHAMSKVEYPRLILRAYNLNNEICVDIEDNGCGIPKEHINSIYDPAFTLKGSKDVVCAYDTNIKGTGYGMANVKKYMLQHHGEINLETKINKGTKFTLKFPLIKSDLTKEEREIISTENFHSFKDILIVEDEHDISSLLYKLLTRKPYFHNVDVATNGQMGIDFLNRNEYDLVHLDYVLPGGISGIDVYKHLRQENEKTLVIFMSGNLEFIESIKELKENDSRLEYISKPCANMEYVKKVDDMFFRLD